MCECERRKYQRVTGKAVVRVPRSSNVAFRYALNDNLKGCGDSNETSEMPIRVPQLLHRNVAPALHSSTLQEDSKMKKTHWLALLAVATMAGTAAAANVNIHVTIGDPGYYGPLDVRGYPAPRLVYAQPVVPQRVIVREPIYLRVPAYQTRSWRSYCGRYNACNRPVYFVQDTWYNDVYAPRYRTRTYENRGYRNDQQRAYRNDTRNTYRSDYAAPAAARENAGAQQRIAKDNAKAAEKQAKAQRKAAEKQAKHERDALKQQAKLDQKQAKLDRQLAEHHGKH
jgi:hypothetical protein